MFQEYALFDITIRSVGPDQLETLVQGGLGGDADAPFVSPAGDPAFQQLIERLRKLDTDASMLTELGKRLFRALFTGRVRDSYIQARSRLKPNQGLRLRFKIAPSLADAAGLPWEFLCDPDSGRPLGLLDMAIVRYLPQYDPPPVLEAALPLKVLLTAASTEPKFDVTQEFGEVRVALAELEARGQVQIVAEEHLTRSKLQRLLRQGFQIWHHIGHGQISADGSTSMLVLEDRQGEPDEISALELGIFLERSGMQLIILDACNSAELTTDPYSSIAPALVQAQVGAVVAMQFKAPQEATQPFASEFYRALAAGFPIDACMTEGRKAVMLASGLRNPDWGIPALYTRAPEGRLFAPSAAPAQPANPAGVNVTIGSGNQLNNSSINVGNIGNTTVASSARSEADQFAGTLTQQYQQLDQTRKQEHSLKMQAAGMGLYAPPYVLNELESAEQKIIDLLQELIDKRGDWAQQLGRRAAGDPELPKLLAEATAETAELALDLKGRQLQRLKKRYEIQPSDSGRRQVQGQINALTAEIAELRRQRDAAQ